MLFQNTVPAIHTLSDCRRTSKGRCRALYAILILGYVAHPCTG